MKLKIVIPFLSVLLVGLQTVVSQVVIKEGPKDGIEIVTSDPNRGTGEIFTSMYDLEMFFKKEKEYVEDIRALIDKKLVTAASAANLRDYISSYEDVIGDQEDDSTFIENPLNVYNLIRHVAIGWGIVNSTLHEEKARVGGKVQNLPKRVRRVLSRPKRDHIPGEADLDGAAVAIVRLHDYYKFNLDRFVNEGVFETDNFVSDTNGDMTIWDAFKIGVKGANKMFLGSGLEIMIKALNRAQSEGITTPPFIEPMDISVLKNLVKTARTVHDQKLDRWGSRTMSHSTNEVPYDKRLAKKKKFTKAKAPFNVILNDSKIVGSGVEKEQYIRLCRGIELRPESVTKNLYCYYGDRNKPQYRYGPRKIEVVSLEPRIVVLHEFITDSEANQLIEQAAPRLRRSEVIGKNNDTLDDGRVSEQTWANELECEAAARITRRIDDFLDLEVRSQTHAELYQVANYGLGGLYTVHYDQVLMDADARSREARQIFNIYAGDRMATIMGYLTDVLAGGYTVFPLVGAFVPPSKGSVVMWWNMDQAGGYDDLTRHGGCPVMIGNKWIMNKWVRSHSQMFKRPCPLQTGREIREVRTKNKLRKGPRFADP